MCLGRPSSRPYSYAVDVVVVYRVLLMVYIATRWDVVVITGVLLVVYAAARWGVVVVYINGIGAS